MGDFSGSAAGVIPSNTKPQLPQDASGGLSPLTADGRTASSSGGQHERQKGVQIAFSNQLDVTSPSANTRLSAYNMVPMTNALHAVAHRAGHYSQANPGQYQQSGTSPSMMQQMSHMDQYGGHQPMGVAEQNIYGQQYTQYYNPGQMPSTPGAGNVPSRQSFHYYQPQVTLSPAPSGFYYGHGTQYTGQGHAVMGQMGGQFGSHGSLGADQRYAHAMMDNQSQISAGQSRPAPGHTSEGRQNAVRGPPRKPRQSGHAIWIGNLPPQADLMSLVHHVCKEAPGLQSLFLISKSNCAFANYKDEATCVAAQQKIHDSKFHSVRLVSRLRKSTVEHASGTIAPTGLASTTSAPLSPPTEPVDKSSSPDLHMETANPAIKSSPAGSGTPLQDKFFILKSLTIEDLELSVRTGIWATQAHNEESLNGAFKTVENVYLVFSANKSGEYFGYARMLSEINKDPAAAIEFAPTTQAASGIDGPKAIPTENTEFAPRGKIIDDSARGTIFWEVERDESDTESDAGSEVSSQPDDHAGEGGKTWGKPFKLEWLSTTRLPFYRTRGLRNPWNSNREVKIARDGTELEPAVGRRLIGLFNRIQSPGPTGRGLRPPMGQMRPGHPQMRPYGQ